MDPNVMMSGEVGKKIKNLEENRKPFIDLDKKKITVDVLPDMDKEMLQNMDVKNLHLLCNMISTGIPNSKLEKLLLPTITGARWLTHSIRILVLYLQENDPSPALKKMVNFIGKN